MSTKKGGKHDQTVANPEQVSMEHDNEVGDPRSGLRKSKTDTKLPKKPDAFSTYTEKG